MRVLITGGSGYLGSEIVGQALAAGWEVVATYFSRRPTSPGAQYLPLDIRDAPDVEQAFADIRPDIVIHTAYRQAGPDLWSATVDGSSIIALAARQLGASLIHLSSDVIFDGEGQRWYTEQDDPRPITPYGEAKVAAEHRVAAAHPGALIVRTSLIYGGAEPSKHEQLVLDAADGHVDPIFFSDELRCPIAVGDLAAALLELAPLDVSGPLHVAGAEAASRYAFAQLVAAAHGRSADRLRSGFSAASGVRRPRNCALDSRKAQAMLRTRLRGVSEVLKPDT